jgi:serine/threonine protein kinase
MSLFIIYALILRDLFIIINFRSSYLNLAPEVFENNGEGYSKTVDIWSFGVMLFEMFYGFSIN